MTIKLTFCIAFRTLKWNYIVQFHFSRIQAADNRAAEKVECILSAPKRNLVDGWL